MNGRPRSFAIVPAAGRSERMGQAKLLLPWKNSRLIDHTLAAWLAGRVTRRIVVIHPEDHALLAHLRSAEVDIVLPPEPPLEMKDSVAIGLEHVAATYNPLATDVWLLAPADMPDLSADVIQQLLSLHDASRPRILVPTFQGRRGHPVLFPWSLAAEVRQLAHDEGINALPGRFPWAQVEAGKHAVPPDIDTIEDYRRLGAEGE